MYYEIKTRKDSVEHLFKFGKTVRSILRFFGVCKLLSDHQRIVIRCLETGQTHAGCKVCGTVLPRIIGGEK